MKICCGCGVALAQTDMFEHVCDEDQRVRFQLFLLEEGIASLERDVSAYLSSTAGRFELWYAERERLRRAA
jgi:hypothetical protein